MAVPVDLHALLARYRLRLTDLGQGNRTLRLLRASARWDADLFDFAHLGGRTPAELLDRIAQRRRFALLPAAGGQDAQLASLDRRLTRIAREVNRVAEETGAYDLCVGYPFVQGRMPDGSVVRAPLLLFPVRLQRGQAGTARWTLEPRPAADLLLNEAFVRAYERYLDIRLPDTLPEAVPEGAMPAQQLLNQLFAGLRSQGLGLQFNSALFLRGIAPFPAVPASEAERWPKGELRLEPYALLGVFPQADTALLQDYRSLDANAEAFDYQGILVPVPGGRSAVPDPPQAARPWVLPVDGPQEAALLRVQAGESLVVDGPPGTGKSQFIVNAVADALARGRRVLVVSQKRAALDVVHARLRELGLGSFACLVHDAQNDRAAVYAGWAERLRAWQAEAPDAPAKAAATDLERAWLAACQTVDALAAPLDELQQALRTPLACGLTPLQLYDTVVAGTLVPPAVQAAAPLLDTQSLARLQQQGQALALYPELLDPTHPWAQRLPFHTLPPPGLAGLRQLLTDLPAQLAAQRDRWVRFRAPDGRSWMEHPELAAALNRFTAVSETLAALPVHTRNLEWALSAADLDLQVELHALTAAYEAQSVLPYPQLVGLDAATAAGLLADAEWLQAQSRSWRRWLRPAWWHLRRRHLATLGSLGIDARTASADLVYDLRQRLAFQALRQRLLGIAFFADLPASDAGAEVWARYFDERAAALAFVQEWQASLPLPWADGTFTVRWPAYRQAVADLATATADYDQQRAEWAQWLHPAQLAQLQAVVQDEGADPVPAWQQRFATDAEALLQFDQLAAQLDAGGQALLPYLSTLWHAGAADWAPQLQAQVQAAWLAGAEAAMPVLRTATQRTFAHDTATLATTLTELVRLQPQRLAAALAERQGDALALLRDTRRSALADVLYQLEKKRRVWPMRRLVAAFWDSVLQVLAPCVLASPETVAAVFPLQADAFDLVVLDEASQLPVEAALPVLLRAPQRVVAGDVQQLPPMSLFQVRGSDDLDADAETAAQVEAESILQLAQRNLPHQPLLRHYRSRHPALIAFSDRHFYRGRLQYLPEPLPPAVPPLLYVHCAEGHWADARNAPEAARVVTQVCAALAGNADASIGVITFSFAQQEAVLDAVEAALADPDLPQAVAHRLREALQPPAPDDTGVRQRFFVKNIENVQGDERDVIVFSIGYAPDANGRVPARFGWLNQPGGENRLNVAVTRARVQVQVVASFLPAQLDVAGTLHAGPKLLRAYLEYVHAGVPAAADAPRTYEPQQSRLAAAVATRLADELPSGWGVVRNLGSGSLYVPVAVHDAAGCFRLGVLVDDEAVAQLPARERWGYRDLLLQARGWQLASVSARAWHLDAPGELAKLRSALK